MAELSDRDREVPAFEHSIRVLQDLRDELLPHGTALAGTAQQSWTARCAQAAYRSRELGWDVAPMLRHWQRLQQSHGESRQQSRRWTGPSVARLTA